jgi:phage terminase large subunit-like protein
MGDGFTVVPWGQGFSSQSTPTKELMNLLLAGKVRHGGNPVLRWMASNVAVEEDAAGNLKPSRRKSAERIDGIVALINALGRGVSAGGAGQSVYASRGLLLL